MDEKLIFKRLCDVLNDAKIKYTSGDRPAVTYGIPLRSGKLKQVLMIHGAEKNGIISYCVLNVKADEACRANVREFIQRLNCVLLNGTFLLNEDTGEIRVRTYLRFPDDADGIILPRQLIAAHMFLPMMLAERYGDALLSVMFGFTSPKDAAESATGKR